MEHMYSFMGFAFVASITSGPTNFLILNQSAKLGIRQTVPVILSACIGAASLVCLTGMGIGQVLTSLPLLQAAMTWGGALWLTRLSWLIATQSITNIDQSKQTSPIIGWSGALMMQIVNPKVWVMAVAVVSVYAAHGQGYAQSIMWLSLIFMCIAIPCLFSWACLGRLTHHLIRHSKHQKWLNWGMATILLFSTWSATLNISV